MAKQSNLSPQNKILVVSFVAFLILYIFIRKQSNDHKTKEPAAEVSADTYIPAGFVLVPILIDNAEALSGLIQQFALVDLYAESQEGSILIASKIKILRAPRNPNQFAVLATEEQAPKIMQIKSKFLVVLQNRNSFSANLEKNLITQPETKTQVTKVSQVIKTHQRSSSKKLQIEYYENRPL